jgi:hypothetical protein
MVNLNPGDRIELVRMTNDPCPIQSGTKGTVQFVGPPLPDWSSTAAQDFQQVAVKWDNGRTLSLVVPPDTYRKL